MSSRIANFIFSSFVIHIFSLDVLLIHSNILTRWSTFITLSSNKNVTLLLIHQPEVASPSLEIMPAVTAAASGSTGKHYLSTEPQLIPIILAPKSGSLNQRRDGGRRKGWIHQEGIFFTIIFSARFWIFMWRGAAWRGDGCVRVCVFVWQARVVRWGRHAHRRELACTRTALLSPYCSASAKMPPRNTFSQFCFANRTSSTFSFSNIEALIKDTHVFQEAI